MVSHGERKRQGVFYHHRVTAHICFATHATELMNSGIGTDVGAVFDEYVAGQGGGVGHNNPVTQEAVMRDVSLGHDEAVIADSGDPAAAGGAAVDRHKLPDPITPADFSGGCFAREL